MDTDVLFIRSYIPDYDGKFQKYQQSLTKNNIKWFFLGWDRTGSFQSNFKGNTYFFRKKASLGGGWKNLANIFLWNLFAAKQVWHNRNSFKVLHIIDFDSAIFTFPLAILLKKKIVFDIYDKYTSMRSFPKVLKKIIDSYENLILKKASLSILADESRFQQHMIMQKENMIVLENIPNTFHANNYEGITKNNTPKCFSIGYFGVLEKNNRGLEDVAQTIISLDNWEFHVAGYGELEDFFSKLAQKNPDKIKFYGSQDSQGGLSIMSNMDIILGLYYKNVPNHLFAAPNKYYEHLMLGKPFLTTKGTPPGIKVEKHNTGWAIDEGKVAIKTFLLNYDQKNSERKSKKAIDLWDEKYINYYDTYYNNIYYKKILSLIKTNEK